MLWMPKSMSGEVEVEVVVRVWAFLKRVSKKPDLKITELVDITGIADITGYETS